MKILHVIASVDPRGGGPIEFIRSVSAEWVASGHSCHVVTLDPDDAPWLSMASLETFAFGLRDPLAKSLRVRGYGLSLRFVTWLSAHGAEYDAIIVHGIWNFASLGTWLGLRGSKTPYFIFTHGMLDPWFNQAYPLKTVLKSLYWRLFEARVLRQACGVFFTTAEERELARKSFSPYSVRPFVVGLGTRDAGGNADLQTKAFVARMPSLAGRRFILFLSRIHPKKGIDLLIQAFAKIAGGVDDLDLVIAGPDQVGLQAELERLADASGLSGRVHWPGMITGDAKLGAFRAAEFFALTSHQENFGIAVAEALASGLPVLITDKVNTWREIEAAGAGLVVADDLASVSRGLARMCALTPDEQSVFRSRARRCFERHYDLGRVAASMIEVLSAQQEVWTREKEPLDAGLRVSGQLSE